MDNCAITQESSCKELGTTVFLCEWCDNHWEAATGMTVEQVRDAVCYGPLEEENEDVIAEFKKNYVGN